MKFINFIQGKKVIFVGACPNLIGKNQGKFIDSFDVVVKSGHSWSFTKEEYTKDYGSRCDMVYCNRQYYREMKPFPIEDMKNRGVKFLGLKGSSPEDFINFNKVIPTRLLKEVYEYVNKSLKSASMGNYIIYDLLMQKPKELYLTGLDFFASKKSEFEHDNYQEYLDGYLPDKIRKQGNIINVGKKADGHDFLGNAKFFYNLFLTSPELKTDNYIYELLENIVSEKVKQGDIRWT